MADKKISQLTAATTPLDGTEVLPIVQSGSTVKVQNNDLRPKQIQSNATSGVLQIVGPAATSTRVMTTPNANFTVARTDAAQTFTGNQTFSNVDITTNLEFTPTSSSLGTAPSITSFSNGYLYILGGTGGLILRDDGGSVGIQIQNDDYIKFETGNPAVESGRFTATGNLNLPVGNLVPGTAAKGVNFTANTAAAGMTSQLLNWYEEGTWTPALAGSGTAGTYELATASGWYTRVGRSITVIFNVKLAAAVTGGGTGFAVLSGLPFSTATTNAAAGAVTLGGVNYTAGTNYVTVMPRSVGSSSLIFEEVNINGAVNDVAISAFGVNDTIQGTLTYIV